jgi:peptidoglycan/LPS O-acetylase OafA/YrhL
MLVAASWLVMQNVLVKHVLESNKAGVYDGDPHVTQVVLAACYLIMLAVALHRFDRLNWRWLSTAGALSYPIYLLHEEMGWALIRKLRHSLGVYPTLGVALVVVVGSAWLLHLFLEKPLAKYLRAQANRITAHH